MPEPHILKATAKIMDLQDPTAKMSESTVDRRRAWSLLSDEPGRIAKKIRSAVTDTEREIRYDPDAKPGVSNLLVIHSRAVRARRWPTSRPTSRAAATATSRRTSPRSSSRPSTPFRERMAELLADPAELDRILADGAERAREVAEATMARVRDRVGLLPAVRSRVADRAAPSASPSPIPAPHGRAAPGQRGPPSATRWRGSIPTHVTLLPPTEIADDDMDGVPSPTCETVSAGAQPFDMVLRGTGTFRPVSPVVFVQVSGGLAELRGARAGHPLGARWSAHLDFHYHPHVTVAHHVDERNLDRAFDELADFECTFEVGAFHLYEHGDDGVWRPVRSFALRGELSAVDTLKRLVGAPHSTRTSWRAWKRYGDSRGNLLAGGVGYFAFFSIFPAVALAFTVFGFVLRNQPQLLQAIEDSSTRPSRDSSRHPTTPTASSPSRRPPAPPSPSAGCCLSSASCWPAWAGSARCAPASARSSASRGSPATWSPTSCATSASWSCWAQGSWCPLPWGPWQAEQLPGCRSTSGWAGTAGR